MIRVKKMKQPLKIRRLLDDWRRWLAAGAWSCFLFQGDVKVLIQQETEKTQGKGIGGDKDGGDGWGKQQGLTGEIEQSGEQIGQKKCHQGVSTDSSEEENRLGA
jgi:hypothetical protein